MWEAKGPALHEHLKTCISTTQSLKWTARHQLSHAPDIPVFSVEWQPADQAVVVRIIMCTVSCLNYSSVYGICQGMALAYAVYSDLPPQSKS